MTINIKEERIYNFLRIFYLLKLGFFSWYFQNYFHQYELADSGHIIIVSLLEKIIVSNTDFIMFSLSYLFVLLFVIYKPYSSKIRLIEAIVSVLFLGLLYNAYEMGSSMFTLLYCSFPLSFLKPSRIQTPIKIALDLHLISYVVAGFWKLVEFIHKLIDYQNFEEYITNIFSNHVSLKAIQIGNMNPIISWFISLDVSIKSILWISVIIFQLLMAIPIIKSNYHLIFGYLIIIFHFLTLLFMDINFFESQLLTGVLFFIGAPLMNEEKDLVFGGKPPPLKS